MNYGYRRKLADLPYHLEKQIEEIDLENYSHTTSP